MKQYFKENRMLRYLLTILFPVVLLTLLFFMLMSSNMVRQATAGMERQSADNADKVNAYMLEVAGDMEDIRELIEMNCSTDDEVVTFVRSTEHYGVFGGVYTGDNTGFYVGSTPWDIPDDYDPTSRPWYIDGKDSRDWVFGEPYLDASVGLMCVSVSARMDAGDDSIVRVVAADIYLDYMDSLAQDIVAGSDLEGALLVTEDGVIIADSTGSDAGTNMAESIEFNQRLDQDLADVGSGLYTVRTMGGTYYVSVEEVESTGWYLLIYENRSIILHDLYVTITIMLMAALFVTLFLTWVMIRYGNEVSEVEQQANKAKTEFISRISHDIRTPIGQVLNLTAFAKADKNDPGKLDEDLDRIDSSGRFLLSLINDVLDVSQIESGLMEMHPAPVSYQSYIADTRNILVPLCESKGLKCEIIEAEDKDTLPALYCDEVRLKQITLNLISNAVKYTPAGGTITYRSESHAKEDGSLAFAFTLSDTGVGMTKEFMEHMFDKFTRDTKNELRDSTQMGSGLGLYLVKNMVTLMGGTIEYQSEQGKGTSVSVRIDMEKAPAAPETQAEDRAADSKAQPDHHYSGYVLLVEDNEINTEIACRMFEELGLTVDHAADGEEAVSKFSESAEGYYRVIFMDIQMPKMNGYDATRAIRGLSRRDAATVPVIAMTADAFKDAMDASAEAGMTGFITKPLIISQICGILDEYM